MTDIGFALARVGLSALFIISGAGKFMNVTGIAGMFTAKGFPQPTALGYATAALEVGAGFLVLIGLKTRWAAWVLLIFTGATIYVSHNFWTMDGVARAMNQTQALKNLAIMGGLLLLALIGPGRYSVDASR